MPSRMLIVDDHALLRMAIRSMLTLDGDLEVVGEAGDGEEALALCRQLRPELVLMDVSMPKMCGIEATRAIKAECPKIGVLMLTAHTDHELLLEAVRAGAAGYVLKSVDPDELVGAVRRTLEGESPVDQELVMRLVRSLAEEAGSTDRTAGAPPPLTPREHEVLRHLAGGKTNRRISEDLHVSLSTVKRHIERIVSKLDVSDRTQAAVKAVELGLIDPERTK
ncbi:MAG TPA: response regulator transcription factor [Rubrobacteraceae bacterium]|nr:response regulator transcription factor [Rubrobacteraceae bacterium]